MTLVSEQYEIVVFDNEKQLIQNNLQENHKVTICSPISNCKYTLQIKISSAFSFKLETSEEMILDYCNFEDNSKNKFIKILLYNQEKNQI